MILEYFFILLVRKETEDRDFFE